MQEKTSFEVQTNNFVSLFGCFFRAILLRSVTSFGIDSSVDLGMSTFFRGIMETVPSLFRAIFRNRIVAHPSNTHATRHFADLQSFW